MSITIWIVCCICTFIGIHIPHFQRNMYILYAVHTYILCMMQYVKDERKKDMHRLQRRLAFEINQNGITTYIPTVLAKEKIHLKDRCVTAIYIRNSLFRSEL